MALTDKEKETLREMERLLEADDPKFGSSMRSAARVGSTRRRAPTGHGRIPRKHPCQSR